MLITSAYNPQIKLVEKLKNRRKRDELGLFSIEGYREISRAVSVVKLEKVFICPELFLGSNEKQLLDSVDCEIISMPPHLFQKISYRDRPDGLIALAKKWDSETKDLIELLKTKENPLLLIAESIEKPGNLGSIMRSCDAIGADGVIVVDKCTDIFNPNVVRSSVGTLFTVPVFDLPGDEVLSVLKKFQVKILSASPDGDKVYTDCSMIGPLAIVVGTEQLGLSKTWMSECDDLVSIPMLGIADSLNVASATTLLLYEALRQRECK